jgi:hypothetical protein
MNVNAASAQKQKASDVVNQPGMDDLMLAMDVVDTLRHEDELVRKELGQDERDEALKQRLREIYTGQGLEVSDRILDDGIRSLREERFTYRPQGGWFARRLAGIWSRRGRYLAAVGAVCVAGGGVGLYNHEQTVAEQRLEVELTVELPKRLEEVSAFARSQVEEPGIEQQINGLAADAEAALNLRDVNKAKTAIGELTNIGQALSRSYELRIVSRPGEYSAVFRIPEDSPGARNYYLIVEAVTSNGGILSLPILNEENGKIRTVNKWGQRVPADTYQKVGADKQDDGIIQNNILGKKAHGYLTVSYTMDVFNGAITQW